MIGFGRGSGCIGFGRGGSGFGMGADDGVRELMNGFGREGHGREVR
jgi:hypothetical protein